MEIFFLITMIVCNLITIGAFYVAAKGKNEYREGMLFGVHIPPDAAKEPDVLELIRSCTKKLMRWNQIHIFFGIAVCFLMFLKIEVMLLIQTVWLCLYIGGAWWHSYVPHRDLYRLKQERHWMFGETRHTVFIDTAASAAPKKKVSWLVHLPVVALFFCCIPLLSHLPPLLLESLLPIFICCAGVELVLLACHTVAEYSHTRVYSEHTELNLKIDAAVRCGLTLGMLLAALCNAAACLILLLSSRNEPWISGVGLLFFTILQFASGIGLFLPILIALHKKSEWLSTEKELLTIDDDEYWKYGFYYNPNDSRTWVADRMSNAGFTCNPATVGGKIFTILSAAIIVGTFALIVWSCVVFGWPKISLCLENGTVSLHGAVYTYEFTESDIEELALLNALPEERFHKRNGGATDEYDIGSFYSRASGDCMFFVIKNGGPVIRFTLPEMTVFLTGNTPDETAEWYRRLREMSR